MAKAMDIDALEQKGAISPDTAAMARERSGTQGDTAPDTESNVDAVRPNRMRDSLAAEPIAPAQVLEQAEAQRALRQMPRDYEVITETGGSFPGQVVERGGRQYFAPAYGPVAGELIEVRPGANLADIQEFAAGPPGFAPRPSAIPRPTMPSGPVAALGDLTPAQQQAMALALARQGG